MSDSINLNDLFAQFETSGIFERFQQRSDRSEEANSNRNDRTDEAARNNRGQGRGQLRATLARRRRNTEAVQVEFTRRAQETRAARETERAEAPERAERPREDAQVERTSLRQRFQQAIEAFRTANQPGQARDGGGGEPQGAAPAAAGAARGTQERQGFQVGNPQAAIGRRDEPRLDGIRMAASFQETALGNALNQNQPPAARRNNIINQGPLTQRQGANATGGAAQNAGETLFGGGGANPTGRANLGAPAAVDRGFGGAEQQTQGPLARVQERFNNPGAPGTDNNPAPLAARAEDDRGGANPEPLVERAIPGESNAGAANAPGAGAGAADRGTGTNLTPNNLDVNNLNNNPGTGAGANPVVDAQVTPDLLNANLGGATGPGADTGALAGGNALAAPADAGGPGVAPPPNPLIPDPTDLLQNTPAAPPGAQNAVDTGTGPAREDVQGGVAPERGATNPPLPEREPIQTPAEEAAALGTTQREAADAELRAEVPRPILEPTDEDGAGRTPGGATADADLRGGGAPQAGAPPNPAAAAPPGNTNAAQNPLVGNIRDPEPTEAARPAAPERTEGGGPGAAAQGPAGNADAAANPEGAAPVVEGPENRAERSALEEALESRATRAYEQQQEETQTTEPNPGQTVTELFVR
ncbi:hypothetical protein ACFL5M_05050 [Candidatus Neomarinimicrobiota bacterium]